MERKYFEINEELAYQARTQWSFREYTKGSTTTEYKNMVDEVYNQVEKAEIDQPQYFEEVYNIALRYSRKLAEWFNTKHSIDMMCPSVMICGPANFPVKKKERQNSREASHWEEYKTLQRLPDKISTILKGKAAIKANDENAIEKLQEKVANLEKEKIAMIAGNKYFKKNGTLEGFTDMHQDKINQVMSFVDRDMFRDSTRIFDTANTNAKIKAAKQRIEILMKEKEKGIVETAAPGGNEFFRVVENTEIMRLQLMFEGKPEEKVRELLKKNGFKWSPKNTAWQRQLTENARYSLKRLTEQLKENA